jgi:hypothetical protein
MASGLPRMRLVLTGAIVMGAMCGPPALPPAAAAEGPSTGAPPGLDLSAPGVAWAGFVAPKEPNYGIARLFNDFASPTNGLGPVTDGPDHPYANNEVAREMRIQPTYRVADLNNAAGKNLLPWVREALARQNELVLRGRNGETREARCWETGVPAFHLNPGLMHIIQTPRDVVLFLTGRARHIWLNVPHSANPKPSWYGESVGHYDGDTLVVDTIGFNDRTFVDSYRTPHTDKLHVVERYQLFSTPFGNGLEITVVVDDPGAFTAPWKGTAEYRQNPAVTQLKEVVCAENNRSFADGSIFGTIPEEATSPF